ncbi:MAG: hypothetical protein M0R80_17565 [Proteobacteria bacterium]|jgi:hypothetical protein|nr:hypothetical protein [Pseudomonadota bacterium]
MAETNIKDELTTREKISIRLIILLIKIVKPFSWDHEFSNAIKPVEQLIDGLKSEKEE